MLDGQKIWLSRYTCSWVASVKSLKVLICWFQELRRHRPDAPPVILCGCGSDLRSDPATQARLAKTGSSPVSPEQALAVCCEIGAVNYVETSSKDNSSDEVSEAFEVSQDIWSVNRTQTFDIFPIFLLETFIHLCFDERRLGFRNSISFVEISKDQNFYVYQVQKEKKRLLKRDIISN